MKRYKHSLSHHKLATFDMGELVPVGLVEVLPGDTIQQASAALVRLSPLVAPVMHPVTVRLHHWFVPNRLLWDGWEEFITGGPDGEGGSSGAFPTVDPGGSGFAAGSLGDYFGVPPGLTDATHRVVSALPFRAYNKIYNEFYRDQDLVSAVSEDSTVVQKCAWEKDYFTSARPWPQKGPEVTLPLGTEAVVKTSATDTFTGAQEELRLRQTAGTFPAGSTQLGIQAGTGFAYADNVATGAFNSAVYPTNLYADLTTATAVDINTVRRAFAIQRYQEARAQYGSRYPDYLRYLGVRSSDARLQRPEYLGGGKQTISFSEVLQTGPDASDDEGVARMKGHGISAMRSRRYRHFFEEHGHVITLMSVRPRSMYVSGVHRMWDRRTKEDFWQKELELIGQQEVLNKEVYGADSGPGDVFGYQDRYSEYRHLPSNVCADFRSTLNFWHLGRIFGSDVALNADFVTCDPSKRIHAVQTNDVLWVMVNHSIQARRMVRHTGVGRVI